MGKFLDADGLKQVWDTAKGTFVKKRKEKGCQATTFQMSGKEDRGPGVCTDGNRFFY